MSAIRIAAAQTPEFRDVEASLAWAARLAERADAEGAALLVLPEGFLQGYLTDEAPARAAAMDLASPRFEAVLDALRGRECMLVMGLIEVEGDRLYNTAVVIRRGALIGRYRKTHLLAGERAFEAGQDCPVFEVDGLKFGVNICYDTNFPGLARGLADAGASLIVCPANNMLRREAAETWKHAHNAIRGERCRETGLWLISADVTGERDGQVAWGPTAVLDPSGSVVARLPLDEPGLLTFDLPPALATMTPAR
ncbi:MAG TPA: carbon-nitrogen hydrolase family protein [Caulobacteraceae bacterium]|nr:carbon-nitrogen hydrolase family protein [Caulobacteraceae bacterium]